MNPVETDYIYFVADGSGGHAFARTLKEHNRNVRMAENPERRLKKASGGGDTLQVDCLLISQ